MNFEVYTIEKGFVTPRLEESASALRSKGCARIKPAHPLLLKADTLTLLQVFEGIESIQNQLKPSIVIDYFIFFSIERDIRAVPSTITTVGALPNV